LIIDNNPPGIPEINGPTNGNAGTKYDWTFEAIDPDGDDMEFFICWGGTCVGQWYGPYASGEVVTKGYTYLTAGTFIIECTARDIYGVEGPRATLEVAMPRNRAYQNPSLQRILEQFPNAFPILRLILGLQ